MIHERAKKAAGGGSRGGASGGATVIENLAQTKRLAETNLSGPSNMASASKKAGGGGGEDDGEAGALDDEKCTNTGSGSQVNCTLIKIMHVIYPRYRKSIWYS